MLTKFANWSPAKIKRLGKALSRRVAGQGDVIVLALISNDDGQFLIVQKNDDDESDGGRWGLTGGHLSGNELPLDALRREVHEETGLNVVRAQEITKLRKPTPDGKTLLTFWLCRTTGRVTLNPNELQSYEWVNGAQAATFKPVGNTAALIAAAGKVLHA